MRRKVVEPFRRLECNVNSAGFGRVIICSIDMQLHGMDYSSIDQVRIRALQVVLLSMLEHTLLYQSIFNDVDTQVMDHKTKIEFIDR
jgi:hypothetical protein